MNRPAPGPHRARGFTLLELLVVIAIIAILASLLLPAIARAKENARRIQCLNNIRQLGLSVRMYVDDHEGFFPLRTYKPCWPGRMSNEIASAKILVCPSDGPKEPPSLGVTQSDPVSYPLDGAPRSFMINGWNDWVKENSPSNFNAYYTTGGTSIPVPESAVIYPSDTIVFGEKENDSGHFYLDYQGYDDVTQLSQNRHGSRSISDRAGGSNHAFCDGSARFLRFGQGFNPVNQWAVTDLGRQTAVPWP
jgi:prepilin-type N-terminal cleavage/methylation domain-containing protein